MTTIYRVVLLVSASSVAAIEDDLGTTLGYSQLDVSLDSVEAELPVEDGSARPVLACPTCGSVRRTS